MSGQPKVDIMNPLTGLRHWTTEELTAELTARGVLRVVESQYVIDRFALCHARQTPDETRNEVEARILGAVCDFLCEEQVVAVERTEDERGNVTFTGRVVIAAPVQGPAS